MATTDQNNGVNTVQAVDAAKAEKASFAKAKRDHELHVALIMRIEDVTKSHALVLAYREGQTGLTKRLDNR